MKTLRKPRRRFGVRLVIEGDTTLELERAAAALLELFRRDGARRAHAHGEGFDVWITRVRDAEEQTDTRYAAELDAYQRQRASIPREAKTADGRFRRRRKKPARARAPKLFAPPTSAAAEREEFDAPSGDDDFTYYDAADDFDDP